MWSKPDDAALSRLLQASAHRNPVPASLDVVGDRGRPVRLPIVLGNPSGSCSLPPGERAAPVWAALLASRHTGAEAPEMLSDDLARDCVLYPDPATLRAGMERWPRLSSMVAGLVASKIALSEDIVGVPDADEPEPAALTEALGANPSASWYALRPGSERLLVVLNPPSLSRWRIYERQRKAKGTDLVFLLRDLVTAHVVALVDEATGDAVAVPTLLERFPGLVSLLAACIQRLAGTAQDARLGEF